MIIPLEDRFFAKVIFGITADDCWGWSAHKQPRGYGTIKKDGKDWLAHRVSWEIHYGPIPLGMCVCHHCDNPPCSNPNHLFLGTMKDNSQDCVRKGRARRNARLVVERRRSYKGMGHPTAKLTDSQVLEIRRLGGVGAFTRVQIAKKFGVIPSTISHIINRRIWKHI